ELGLAGGESVTTKRWARHVRWVPRRHLSHDVELRRIGVCHRRTSCRSIGLDHVDDRPVREAHYDRADEALERDSLVSGDEKISAQPREQPLPRLRVFLVGDVENGSDELGSASCLTARREMHSTECECPALAAILVNDAILALKATVARWIGCTRQGSVQAGAIVGGDARLDDSRRTCRIFVAA